LDKIDSVHPAGRSTCLALFALVATIACCTVPIQAQAATENAYYARRNTFGAFVAYSWDSSHILMGYAEHRKLLNLGVSYSRRLFVNHVINWQYNGELMPVALESDPVQVTTSTVNYTNPTLTLSSTVAEPTVQACQPSSGSGTYPDGTYTYVSTCTRRWVAGQAMSPIGFDWNFLPLRRMQPFLDGHGGYMYSTQPVPINYAGSFNFTFDFGAGIEIYRTRRRSIRAEYRYHHLSNHNTASENPGVDNGLLQVTWCFGR
jgi:Lipid A 3-O-deacylase (PagL)